MIAGIFFGLIIGACSGSIRNALLVPAGMMLLLWGADYWHHPFQATYPSIVASYLYAWLAATIASVAGLCISESC